ncbi:DNA-binding response regulator [Actinocatenispora thailandica]|uniref:DNA-binding response regulator n=1 Tax=Actinocatenispora thailandica TaxID=227318 RepID=A0A7R7DTY3_9ACTN|nr:response regulator transcription factor [Actinocatenispora thailandica]BCJ37799.1 DNA-binding response regulator [Actinocatenispora thailandica]
MRSVLVCVRTPVAAQRIAAWAAHLGVAAAVRTALSGEEALARMGERPADVVLIDVGMTRPDPVQFTRRVLSRGPHTALVLVGADDPRAAAAAVAAGARGVIRAGEHGEDLVSALAQGILLACPNGRQNPAGSPTLGRPAQPAGPRRGVLTERELQVLRGMSEGKSNAEIGRELFVSEDTVKTHARRLFRKLGARDRAHAVASAFRSGLVS